MYFAEDDPLISPECIDYEMATKNHRILLCTTKHGAHLSNFEHFFQMKQWLGTPAFEFFKYFRQKQKNEDQMYSDRLI